MTVWIQVLDTLQCRACMYLLGAFSFLSDDQAGEWDGMVAELVNKKADIALGSLRFSYKKHDFCNSKKYEKNMPL